MVENSGQKKVYAPSVHVNVFFPRPPWLVETVHAESIDREGQLNFQTHQNPVSFEHYLWKSPLFLVLKMALNSGNNCTDFLLIWAHCSFPSGSATVSQSLTSTSFNTAGIQENATDSAYWNEPMSTKTQHFHPDRIKPNLSLFKISHLKWDPQLVWKGAGRGTS